MATPNKKRHKQQSAAMREYQQSMGEFREVLQRAGHKISYHLDHPEFLKYNPASRTRRKKP